MTNPGPGPMPLALRWSHTPGARQGGTIRFDRGIGTIEVEVMDVILLSPRPSVADPQITPTYTLRRTVPVRQVV